LVWTGFGFFKKNSVWLLFFYKKRTESKIITLKTRYIWFWDLLSLNIKTSFHKVLCQINEILWIFFLKKFNFN
jgi:hypothetical protein